MSIHVSAVLAFAQTTASLCHARRRDKADLSQRLVQMKLSVIGREERNGRTEDTRLTPHDAVKVNGMPGPAT